MVNDSDSDDKEKAKEKKLTEEVFGEEKKNARADDLDGLTNS